MQQHRKIIGTAGICVLLCVLVMIFVGRAAMPEGKDETVLELTADSVEIMQGEEVPELKATAVFSDHVEEKEKKKFLSKEAEYTVQDLVDDLNKGDGYEIKCSADGTEEGSFPVEIKFSSDLKNSLESEWLGKVKVVLKNGTVKVKNKYGNWDGSKFRKNDGAYAKNEFIRSEGKTYYFNGKGNFIKGWKTIGGARYYFKKDGSMKIGWHDDGEATYYMKEDGSAAVGWQTIGEDRYYFDAEGKMQTGKKTIGVLKCVFGKDGKLKSVSGGADKEKPMIALTFDDGPGQRTEEVLEQLEKYHARATFFMLGQNVKRYSELVKRMSEIHCELGNHSYDHAKLTILDEEKVKEEIQNTNEEIRKAAGLPPTLVRPPYGAINDTVKTNVGMPIIMWSIDTEDWKTKDTEKTINTVLSKVKDGDIILMHDIHSSSVDAALRLIPELQKRGFQLVTVSELAMARDASMQNGGKYYNFYK